MNDHQKRRKKDEEIIYKFIENELKTDTQPIYADIARRLFEEYNIDVYPAKISKICKEIAEQKGIHSAEPKPHICINVKKRELLKLYEEADAFGITDEEVFLCRTRGYAYSLMCRIYFELTGKTLDVNYFSAKYINYCQKNGIKYKRNISPKEYIDKFLNITADEFEAHSKFFKRIYVEEKTRNSAKQRQATSKAANDPYHVLHNEMHNVQKKKNVSFDYDER